MEASGNSPLGDGGIVYNVTIKVDPQIEEQWIDWQKNVHIPEVMATGLFSDHKFFRLLEQDEADGITYVTQYFSPSIDNYKKYIDEFAALLNEKAVAKWNHQFVSFHSVMKIVN